jgi:hypothetical protein
MPRRTPPVDLRYELASHEDAPVCNALNNDCYQRSRSLEQWKWEFHPPHLPFDQIPYAVARDGADIVGTQGYIIVPMLSESGPFLTAKGEDAVVLFKYWGNNVLPGLWATLLAFCESHGIPMVWGFNGRKASFSRVGLQYFDEPSCREMFRPLNQHAMDTVLRDTSKMKKIFDRPGGRFVKSVVSLGAFLFGDTRMLASCFARFVTGRPRKNIAVAELKGMPGDEFEVLSRRFIKHYGGITVHRSPAFLKWRLLDNPFLASTIVTASVHGDLCGYGAFSVAPDGQAYITDHFICVPEGTAEQNCVVAELLMEAIIQRAKARKASVLRVTTFNSHPADAIFRQAAQRVGFLSHPMVAGACYRPVPGADALPKAATNYDEWFVTGINYEGRHG